MDLGMSGLIASVPVERRVAGHGLSGSFRAQVGRVQALMTRICPMLLCQSNCGMSQRRYTHVEAAHSEVLKQQSSPCNSDIRNMQLRGCPWGKSRNCPFAPRGLGSFLASQ
eukprot:2866536-Amphidinium_carterae.1